jgi:hypothetical protein
VKQKKLKKQKKDVVKVGWNFGTPIFALPNKQWVV